MVVRLADGSILTGYSPAFDPEDRSLWLSPAPDSPVGSMIALERVEVLVLERRDGRPLALPGSAVAGEPSCAVLVSFPSGRRLIARQKADTIGLGLWVQPAGRAFARAFVPEAARATVELHGSAALRVDEDDGWSFLVHPSGLVARDGTPTEGVPVVRRELIPPPAPPSATIERPSFSSEPTTPMEILDPHKTEPDLRKPDFDE